MNRTMCGRLHAASASTEPRCIEGNQGLPGLLHGRRVEDLAFAQGRGPDPATTDNTANFASTVVLEDPLQQ
jgi:hypothetical protein